jgi:hypothetical protein
MRRGDTRLSVALLVIPSEAEGSLTIIDRRELLEKDELYILVKEIVRDVSASLDMTKRLKWALHTDFSAIKFVFAR